jgi:hypothetical protein
MRLEVPFVRVPTDTKEDFLKVFDQLAKNQIDQSSWGKADEKLAAKFSIVHDNQSVLLLYHVTEKETRAVYSSHQDPVYKDSCVEFFVSFEGDANYYNFEFNSLGTCLSAYGPARNGRQKLPVSLINQIQSRTNIRRVVDGDLSLINWQLALIIPLPVFQFSKIKQLSGQKATANFYKCGDDLSEPHFLSWKRINTPEPDFHQPKYFGELIFL